MKKISKGFSIVELMITIAIATILFIIGVPTYLQYVQQSRRLDGQSTLLKLQQQMEEYMAQNGVYPYATYTIPGACNAETGICSSGTVNSPIATPATTYYTYNFVSTNTTYTLTATATGKPNLR